MSMLDANAASSANADAMSKLKRNADGTYDWASAQASIPGAAPATKRTPTPGGEAAIAGFTPPPNLAPVGGSTGNYGWPAVGAAAPPPASPAPNPQAPAPTQGSQAASEADNAKNWAAKQAADQSQAQSTNQATWAQYNPYDPAKSQNWNAESMVNAYAGAGDNADTVAKLNSALSAYGVAPVSSLAQAQQLYPNYAETNQKTNPFGSAPPNPITSAMNIPNAPDYLQPWFANSNLGRGMKMG